MKRVSAFCAAVLMSVLFTGPAHAATATVNGYVCSATYTRQSNVLYGQGWVQLQVHTGPGCSGSVVGNYFYLGSGASAAGYQHSEPERLQLFQQATQAATQSIRVTLVTESTAGAILHTTYRAD